MVASECREPVKAIGSATKQYDNASGPIRLATGVL